MTRFSAIGICLVGILSSNLVGCGDGETAKAAKAPSSGGAEEGGSGGDSSEGGTTATGGTTAAGAADRLGTGGSVAGSAGAPGTGATAGTSAAGAGQGGVTTGGSAGSGATAGKADSGGTSTGGTAGTMNTGGAGTAGAGGVAGSGQGGLAGTGNVGTGGQALTACTVAFVLPASGATLTEANDASGGLCADGFFYDVVVATNAPNGTQATLAVGSATPVTATVQNATARFPLTQMGTSGTQNLAVQIAGGVGYLACSASESVTVNCLGHSSCSISKPTFTATHVALNGVPVAQGGDRVSSDGSPYQAAFEVTTDIQDGQPVTLTAANGTTTTTVFAVAMTGKATFPGVTLGTDGTYTATATCQARSGAKAASLPLTVPVDTASPDLTLSKGTIGGVALGDGDHFAPTDLVGGAMRICGATTATDAIDLDTTAFGSLASNFCASVGGNTPVCAPALSTTSNGGCVDFPCPGNGPFDLTLTLHDKAQNPTSITRQNLTCAASNPVVQFQDPVSGGNGADPTSFTNQALRILAATATGTGQKKDKNGTTLGAQYDVVVCTSAPAGSSAVLKQGWYGDAALAQGATATVVADSGGLCQGAQPSVAVFTNVTLNESTVKTGFLLDRATELSVTVTDLNFGTATQVIDVWVDSVAPTLNLVTPTNFCGSYINSGTASPQSLTFNSTAVPVTAVVTSGGNSTSYPSTQPLSVSSLVTISGVSFPVGESTLTASVAKPSGNTTVFPSTGTCRVTVGITPPPTVTWAAASAGSSPVSTSLLTAPGNTNPNAIVDADTSTAGWQGTLRACSNLTGAAASGVTMQFAVNGTDTGVPQNLDQTTGCATLAITEANAVPEGSAVQLTARTSVTANGVGTASITVPVDVTKPMAPASLTAKTKVRRQTSFTLTWSLPVESSTATGFNVRVSKAVIDTSAKFLDTNVSEVVPFTGTPQTPGQTESVDVVNRYIENNYYFAVQAVDSVGNVSDITYTPGTAPTIEHFTQTEILPPATVTGTNFGWAVDGTADLNGDGYSDLIVGSSVGTNVFLYFGSSTGYPTSPSVTIQGASPQFGRSVAAVGDLNKDGRIDIAVGSPAESAGNGAVFIFYGRSTWPTTIVSTSANVLVYGDATADSKYTGSQLGRHLARLGDFNNDGVDDVVIGAPYYNPLTARNAGQVIVLYGKSGGITSPVVLPTAFGGAATRVDGDTTTAGRLGFSVAGAGYFYSTIGGTALLASAPYTPTTAGASAGRLYSISGRSGTPESIAISAASNTFDSPVAGVALGFYGLQTLGDMGPGGQPAFGVPYLASTSSYMQARSGTSSDGPFGQSATITTLENSAGRVFAQYIGTSGISGTSTALSVVRGSKADLVVSTQASGSTRLFVVDGDRISYGGSTNIEALADVVVPVKGPTTGAWSAMAGWLTLIRDADGDGVSDIVVGDVSWGSTPVDGRLVILR